MRLLRLMGFAVALVFVLAPTSAQGGWSLWPFSKSDELRQPPATRQMTGMSNNWGGRQTLDNDDPSVFTRMTDGTQRFVNSTKQALSFGGSKKAAPTSWTGKSSSAKKKKKSSSGSMFSWGRSSEQEGPRTMKEWFQLERPE